MFNWYELKSHCISQVAREIARPRILSVPQDARMTAWATARKAAEPEAIEKINAMTNMELLDLISEVVGSA